MSKVVMGLFLLTYLLLSAMRVHAHCSKSHPEPMNDEKMTAYVNAVRHVVQAKKAEAKENAENLEQMISEINASDEWEKKDEEAKALQLYNGPMSNKRPSSLK